MNKTILFIHSSDELYGADRILLLLVESVLECRDRPVVIVPGDIKPTSLSDELRRRGVTVYKLDIPVLRRRYFSLSGIIQLIFKFVSTQWNILEIIRRENVNIIHSNTLAVVSGAISARLLRKPHVWHVHEIITSPRILAKATAWLAGHLSDAVVCVSTATQENLIRNASIIAHKSTVIYNGIDLQKFDDAKGMGQTIRVEWGVGDQDILIGMVGRISNWKGQDYLLQVASLLLEEHSLVFIMVGGGVPGQDDQLDKITEMRQKLGLGNKVIIEKFRNDIPYVLDAFDIFVLPSTLPDPFPTVVLEAMAMSKPIVANKHGGSVEMIEDGISGFLVSPGRPVEMAERIKELAHHEQLRNNIGKSARQRLETNFSLKQFKEKWINIYDCLEGMKNL